MTLMSEIIITARPLLLVALAVITFGFIYLTGIVRLMQMIAAIAWGICFAWLAGKKEFARVHAEVMAKTPGVYELARGEE